MNYNYIYENSILNYERIGEGKPVVIFHGFGGNGTYMKECMEPVFEGRENYQRIYVDLPGMGKSRFELKHGSSDEILKILTAFMKDCVHDRFLLVGQSYGGYIARGVLSRFYKQADGMMLLCPVVFPEKGRRTIPKTNISYVDETFLKQLNGSDRDSYLEYAVVVNETTYKRFHKAAYTALMEGQQDFLKCLECHYSYSFDVDEVLRRLGYKKPVQFIAARQDVCVGYQDLWNLVEDYPRAGFSVVDMAGHNMQTEQPSIFCALVRNWLLEVEEAAKMRETNGTENA